MAAVDMIMSVATSVLRLVGDGEAPLGGALTHWAGADDPPGCSQGSAADPDRESVFTFMQSAVGRSTLFSPCLPTPTGPLGPNDPGP
eukprot:COSAG02_NODE_2016_length_10101_cov_10.944011_4_plen_87_part_00